MDEQQTTQMADFLQIALTEMEKENHALAKDFVEDVYEEMIDEINE